MQLLEHQLTQSAPPNPYPHDSTSTVHVEVRVDSTSEEEHIKCDFTPLEWAVIKPHVISCINSLFLHKHEVSNAKLPPA